MTANDSPSYLGYLNKLIDEYKNSYHRSRIKLQNLKLVIESGLLSTRLFLA